MTFRIVLLAGAEADLLQAAGRYELRTAGAGERFIIAVEHRLELLSQNPQLGGEYRHPFRRLLVLKYPYGIFYETAGRRIVVHTVQDLRRDPDRIVERLFDN